MRKTELFPKILRENRGAVKRVLRSESSRFVKLEKLAEIGGHSIRAEALAAKGRPCILSWL